MPTCPKSITNIKPTKAEPIKYKSPKKSKPIVYIDNDYLISAANEELESDLSTHLPISAPEVIINTKPTESTSTIPQTLALFNISLAFLTGILALISLAIRPTNNVASLIIGIIACITGLSSGQSLAAAKAASKILGGLLVGQVTISILKSKSFHFKK